MNLSLQNWNEKISELEVMQKVKQKELHKTRLEREEHLLKIEQIRKSQGIVNRAVEITQKHLEVQISSIVSSLLKITSDDPYEFEVKFVPRRNSMECDLMFKRGKKRLHILESCGHGCADLASIGLKISYQKLKEGILPVLIMDEPFRQLQKNLHPIVAEAINEICNNLHMQFIIITHEKSLIENADRVFEIKQKGGVSYVE